MKMKKILSLILVLATVIGCFAITGVSASAATTSAAPELNYQDVLVSAYDRPYNTAEDFLAAELAAGRMQLMASAYGYNLYANKYTGEIAYKNTATGQVLTSNPYNFSGLQEPTYDYTKNDTYTNLLSQVEVSFVDNANKKQTFTSFVEAAARNQIAVKYMKNGFRVEYTMGRLNTTYLLPGVILESDYQLNMIDPIDELLYTIEEEFGMDSAAYEDALAVLMTLDAWYLAVRYDDPSLDATLIATLEKKYPMFAKQVPQLDEEGNEIKDADGNTLMEYPTLRVLDEFSENPITDTERVKLENYLKTYCPDLDYDMLDAMHAKTGYVADVNETPVFRAAIEYILEKDGLSVRLPATSIRFDETKYTLQYIKILQFFGAGDLSNDGYVFYPDGSGAIVEFRDFYSVDSTDNREAFTLSGTVYGEDFAYYDIDKNSKHAEVIRTPVFGIVENAWTGAKWRDSGFFAVLEEGDALADIATFFGGGEFNYATAYAMFYPRPSDKYNLSDVISVADNEEMTIVSEKKYTGFYKLKYMMLFDKTDLSADAVALGQQKGEAYERYYASYSGMANAYRDYLIARQVISRKDENDVQENKLPLYIETLGSVETTKKVLSIPVQVDVPLTSFPDIVTMYEQLAEENITNINFKLTGYANGGLDAKYPTKVKWMKAVQKSNGEKLTFRQFSKKAEELGFGVYPEFDFTYSRYKGGVNLRDHAARAVDDRYCSKQLYDPVYQEFSSYFDICISPSSIYKYVKKFTKSYSKYDPQGLSVSTLGSDLNSDFNRDNSLNRQDAQDFVIDSLGVLSEKYDSIMAEGGNIYTVEYLDHVLNLPLDASNYKYESKAVPFLGMVLHGYVNYAGGILNEAGDSSLQLLKSIENGALLYYMLIYQNSHLLKEDKELSKYYSVRFDIWFETIVEQYETLNGAIGDLQLYEIVEHDFLTGERIPTAEEDMATVNSLDSKIKADLESQYKLYVAAQRRSIRIRQTTLDLIRSGYTNVNVVLNKVAYVLGDKLTDEEKVVVTEILIEKMAQKTILAGNTELTTLVAKVAYEIGEQLTDTDKATIRSTYVLTKAEALILAGTAVADLETKVAEGVGFTLTAAEKASVKDLFIQMTVADLMAAGTADLATIESELTVALGATTLTDAEKESVKTAFIRLTVADAVDAGKTETEEIEAAVAAALGATALTDEEKAIVAATLTKDSRAEALAAATKQMLTAGYTEIGLLQIMVSYELDNKLSDEQAAIVASCLDDYNNGVAFKSESYYAEDIHVTIDRAALEAKITAITGVELTKSQKAILDAFEKDYCVDSADAYVIEAFTAYVSLTDNTTDSFAQDDDYKDTAYTDRTGRIVLVTYEKDGQQVHFVLNYNTYDVSVRLKGVNNDQAFKVPTTGFRRIDGTKLVEN